MFCGQTYKQFTIVIYDSRGVLTVKLPGKNITLHLQSLIKCSVPNLVNYL